MGSVVGRAEIRSGQRIRLQRRSRAQRGFVRCKPLLDGRNEASSGAGREAGRDRWVEGEGLAQARQSSRARGKDCSRLLGGQDERRAQSLLVAWASRRNLTASDGAAAKAR